VENLRKSGDFISNRAQAMLIQSNLGLNFEQEANIDTVKNKRNTPADQARKPELKSTDNICLPDHNLFNTAVYFG
jgi:hypothetical protein